MRRPEPESPGADARSRAAAEWLVRRDRGLTAAEQDEFLQWRAADPRHGEWFALHRGTGGDFSALAHWPPEPSEEPTVARSSLSSLSRAISAPVTTLVEMPPGMMAFTLRPPGTPPQSSSMNFANE